MAWLAKRSAVFNIKPKINMICKLLNVVCLQPHPVSSDAFIATKLAGVVVTNEYGSAPVSVFFAAANAVVYTS